MRFSDVARSMAIGGVALTMAALPVKAQDFVNILTGGTSGVYYPLGVALSNLYAEALPDAKVQVQSTKASVENLNLIQQGKGEVAFALGDSVKNGWEGNTELGFPGKLDKLRAIAAIYPNYVQIVASQDSGIKTLADLKGKSVSVGAPKSGTELNARAIFGAADITYDDLGRTEYLPFGESVELMKNRQLDATLQSAGLGVASIRDLASSIPIQMVEVPPAVIDAIGAPYQSSVIPAGTYDGQTEDVNTAAITNILVTSADLDDDTVYALTKAMFENLDAMVAAHAAAKMISTDTATKGLPIPLHPGAERYYKEKGIL
ncbi:TAXI family TRAP transporter solute-binding subunit [Bauldia litoralis]|uniref:TAXI family TRAP transporter solute-binding subunit n=1 Tax=Bauldia litoralis TaxID=665467 RepID=UPI003262FDB4